MQKNVRVKTWEEFKGIAIEKRAKSIVYIIAQSIPARNLTALKLILPVEGTQYIFTDCAKGSKLRKTGIAIHTDKKGNRFIEDDDVKSFLKTQLEEMICRFSLTGRSNNMLSALINLTC